MGNVQVVDQSAPVRIVATVRANEPGQVRAVDRQLDELIAGRMIEPLAPHTQPFRGEVSVEELVAKGAAIVLAPALSVQFRDRRRVGRLRWSIRDHLPAPLKPAAVSCSGLGLLPTAVELIGSLRSRSMPAPITFGSWRSAPSPG